MAIFIVSYDLRAPGRNYQPLYDAMRGLASWAKPLESFWLLEAEGPASRIRDILGGLMDTNDGLAVIEFTQHANWALRGINKPSSDWIQAKRP